MRRPAASASALKAAKASVGVAVEGQAFERFNPFLAPEENGQREKLVLVRNLLEDFADLPIVRYPMQPLQRRALSLRHNFTAYDAFYVALAESLGMPLLTDDSKFAKAPTPPAPIEVWSA